MREKDLTLPETEWISAKALCPDCRIGFLLRGPFNGTTLRVRCDNVDCHQEFNLAFRNGYCVAGTRRATREPEMYSEAALAKIRHAANRMRLQITLDDREASTSSKNSATRVEFE